MSLALADRLDALERALDAGQGALPAELVAQGRAVVRQARERAGLSAEHTVVVLAGATGSGKSSVFNALVGAEVATAGVHRPTTSHALAAVRGAGAEPLLDWLEVSRRHDLPATAVPGADGGLVLLDLPDHDSLILEHRERAERLVARADLLVWVVDPQKYADAVLHERYLRPLSAHAAVVVLALNQVDRLDPAQADAVLGDLRRLAAADGLGRAPVVALSARTGQGVAQLRALLDEAASRRRAATLRRVADVAGVARLVLAQCGAEPAAGPLQGAQRLLVDAYEESVGVPIVVDAVRRAANRRARAHTGWPPVRWVARLRPDPLRRLHLQPRDAPGGPGRGSDPTVPDADVRRTSLPGAGPAGRARAAGATRAYVDAATAGIPDAWVLAAREAARTDGLAEDLDAAVARTPLLGERPARWWRAVGALQWLLLATAGVGAAWLAVRAAAVYLGLPQIGLPVWGRLPVPTALVLGGLVGGVLLAVLGAGLAALGARRRAAAARRHVRAAVLAVARERVVDPVHEQLAALRTCRDEATRAAAGAR